MVSAMLIEIHVKLLGFFLIGKIFSIREGLELIERVRKTSYIWPQIMPWKIPVYKLNTVVKIVRNHHEEK